jgi:tripartite-type tricarboxylate transporter receptor subunit TctC
MMQDAIGGHVPMVVGSVFVVKPHIDSGRVRALAVTTAKRSPELPNVPTLAELGYGQFEAPAWWAVLAPAKTPPEIIAKMNAAMNAVMQNPEVAKKLQAQGINVIGGTPDTARVFIEKQVDIWGKVVKDYGIKAD